MTRFECPKLLLVTPHHRMLSLHALFAKKGHPSQRLATFVSMSKMAKRLTHAGNYDICTIFVILADVTL
jgi:hypothetical protein